MSISQFIGLSGVIAFIGLVHLGMGLYNKNGNRYHYFKQFLCEVERNFEGNFIPKILYKAGNSSITVGIAIGMVFLEASITRFIVEIRIIAIIAALASVKTSIYTADRNTASHVVFSLLSIGGVFGILILINLDLQSTLITTFIIIFFVFLGFVAGTNLIKEKYRRKSIQVISQKIFIWIFCSLLIVFFLQI